MQEFITIMGVKICLNDKLRANKSAQAKGICKCDDIVEVRTLRVGERIHVGLYSHQQISGWGDLDGMVPSRQGLWQDSRFLLSFFELIHQDKVVAEDFNFKKRNLKGMRCKVVHHNGSRGQSFVEFDEDVGGGSADGLGKTGFCVALPSELLKNVDKSPIDEPKEKKKVVEEVVEVEKLPYPVDPELWDAIADPETIDPEPIAIKAKLATKLANTAKQYNFIKQQPTDIEWVKAAKRLWNEDSEGNEIRWIDPVESDIFEPNLFDE